MPRPPSSASSSGTSATRAGRCAVPRDLQERSLALSREAEALSKVLGRSPTIRELATSLGCSVEAALEASEAAASYEAASLDAPATRDEDEAATLLEHLLGDSFGHVLRARREPRCHRQHLAGPSESSSARWWSCASCTISRSARSATRSAIRRCTCHAFCGAPSVSWRMLQKPPERPCSVSVAGVAGSSCPRPRSRCP